MVTLLRQIFVFYAKYFIDEAPVWTRKLMSVVVVIDKVDSVEIAFAFFYLVYREELRDKGWFRQS